VEISAYNVRKLAAAAHRCGYSRWLELTITERFGATDAPSRQVRIRMAPTW
jgi:hypothetical protein